MLNLSERARFWLVEVLFLLVVVVSCRPLWLTEWIPLQDFPQHLAAIRVLHDYSQGGLGFASWFELTPMSTQYIGFYFLASLFSYAFEVETATRVLLALSMGALPYAMRFLLGNIGRPQWLALFVIPLGYNTNFILGFLNFTAALPLMVLGLGLAAALRDGVTVRRTVLYGLTAAGCFLMHVLPFGVLVIGTVCMGMTRDWRLFAKRLLPLVPVFVVAAIWSAFSKAGGSIWAILRNSWLRLVGTPEREASFMTWGEAVRQIPDWLMDVVKTPGEDVITIFYLGLVGLSFLLASALYGWRGRGEGDSGGDLWKPLTLVVVVVVSWMLYFLLPQGHDWVWPIASRFALIGAILSVPLIPAVRIRGVQPVFIGGLVVLIFAQSVLIGRDFQSFQDEEVADFAQAVEVIPEGQRVAGLIFDRGSQVVRFSPFIHSAALLQSKKGGAVMFTFADFPQSPFRFREDNRPPRVNPRWEWTPEKVDPRSDLGWYNYVLVRGGPGKIRQQSDSYEQVYLGDRWSVWKRKLD